MTNNKKHIILAVSILILVVLGLSVNFFLLLHQGRTVNSLSNQLCLVAQKLNSIEMSPTAVSSPPASRDTSSFSDNQIIFKGIELTLPSGWKVTEKKTENDSFGKFIIKTDYQLYTVFVRLNIVINPSYKDSFLRKPARFMVGDIKIVQNACGGALRCDGAIIENDVYLLNWNIEKTTQPVPTNLDGIWEPDHNVTEEKMDNILKTIKRI